MDPQKVVAALLVEGDRVLVSKRLVDDHFPGLWEFPGGKVEAGESLAEALIRELKEELDLDIEVGRLFAQLEFPYRDKRLMELHFFFVTRKPNSQPVAVEVQEFEWANADRLGELEFIPSNAKVVLALRDELS